MSSTNIISGNCHILQFRLSLFLICVLFVINIMANIYHINLLFPIFSLLFYYGDLFNNFIKDFLLNFSHGCLITNFVLVSPFFLSALLVTLLFLLGLCLFVYLTPFALKYWNGRKHTKTTISLHRAAEETEVEPIRARLKSIDTFRGWASNPSLYVVLL